MLDNFNAWTKELSERARPLNVIAAEAEALGAELTKSHAALRAEIDSLKKQLDSAREVAIDATRKATKK